MKNVLILLFHDFAFAVKSKSIYLVFFIPLFVFASEHLIDKAKAETDKFKIARISSDIYSPHIAKALGRAETLVDFIPVGNIEEGRRLLQDHSIQGVVAEDKPRSDRLSLIVMRKDSIETLAIVQLFSALQKAEEKGSPNWISQITSLREGGLQSQTLSTWILMLVLLVGFVILPTQVAEEKEKKLILAVLQTPINESQWLIAKALFGTFLTLLAVALLSALGRFTPQNLLASFAFIALGGFCFSASGIFLGLLCRHQASARTLGFIFYLPLLLPSALADFSKKLTVVAPFLPSYQFFSPLHELLFGHVSSSAFIFPTTYLFALGSVLFGLSYLVMKKRWLMNT